MSNLAGAASGAVDLYWIPLGAGAHFVRMNGRLYEAIAALVERRRRLELFHTCLVITLSGRTFTVEMTPIPRGDDIDRGVVAEGPVGHRWLGGFRLFRYEVRRWRDGVVPDLAHAVASPVRITDDAAEARRVWDALPHVPRAVWGRDELHAGEMWSCNSIISWALATAGVDVRSVTMPTDARAPGWDAGIRVAGRDATRRVAPQPPIDVHHGRSPRERSRGSQRRTVGRWKRAERGRRSAPG